MNRWRPPRCTQATLSKKYGTHRGEAVNIHSIPIDLLGPLITSKTRLKLLLRFFLNRNLSGYLQGLSKELDENTNSIRVELNRLEEAGILSSELEGRRKLYRVNELHPLTENLTAIVRKVTGVDALGSCRWKITGPRTSMDLRQVGPRGTKRTYRLCAGWERFGRNIHQRIM